MCRKLVLGIGQLSMAAESTDHLGFRQLNIEYFLRTGLEKP
jgi:hypothetical protein